MSHPILPKDQAQAIWQGQDLINAQVNTSAPGFFDPTKYYEIYYDGSNYNALTLQEWQNDGFDNWTTVSNAFAADSGTDPGSGNYNNLISSLASSLLQKLLIGHLQVLFTTNTSTYYVNSDGLVYQY